MQEQHVNDVVAQITSGHEPIGADLSLNAQVPLLHVRFLQIMRKNGVTT